MAHEKLTQHLTKGNYRARIQPGLIWLQKIYCAGWRCLRKQTARMAETVCSFCVFRNSPGNTRVTLSHLPLGLKDITLTCDDTQQARHLENQIYSIFLSLFLSFFFFFPWYGPFEKSLLNLLQYCFLFFYVLGFGAPGIWNFSFPTKDQTSPSALEGKVLTTGPPGKSLKHLS